MTFDPDYWLHIFLVPTIVAGVLVSLVVWAVLAVIIATLLAHGVGWIWAKMTGEI